MATLAAMETVTPNMNDSTSIETTSPTQCTACGLGTVCHAIARRSYLPESLLPLAFSRQIAEGDYVYRSGEPFNSILVVNTGCIRSQRQHNDGHFVVSGFHLPGDLMGLAGIYSDHYHCDAQAIVASEVCVIPYADIEQQARVDPEFNRQFHRLLSQQISVAQSQMLQLGATPALERVVAFLLDLARRINRGMPLSSEFALPMDRADIASFLGLTLETISRILGRLKEREFIDVRRKQIQLRDAVGLNALLHHQLTLD